MSTVLPLQHHGFSTLTVIGCVIQDLIRAVVLRAFIGNIHVVIFPLTILLHSGLWWHWPATVVAIKSTAFSPLSSSGLVLLAISLWVTFSSFLAHSHCVCSKTSPQISLEVEAFLLVEMRNAKLVHSAQLHRLVWLYFLKCLVFISVY